MSNKKFKVGQEVFMVHTGGNVVITSVEIHQVVIRQLGKTGAMHCVGQGKQYGTNDKHVFETILEAIDAARQRVEEYNSKAGYVVGHDGKKLNVRMTRCGT